MPRSHLTLAALAVAAVPGFDPVAAQTLSTNQHGEFDTALVRNADGRNLVVRVGTSETAAQDLNAQIVVLSAMSSGVRSMMPFEVPTVAGRALARDTLVGVFEYIPGNVISSADFDNNVGLATIVGRAVAYIHQVPFSFAQEAGVPVFSAVETQRQAHELVNRGKTTGLLPASLAQRWLKAVEDDSLWQFTPCLVHGSLGPDRFVLGDDSAAGVLGWGAARIGDPAWDLHWLVNIDLASQSEAFAAYEDVRLSTADPKVRQRAVLYSELELVRWLIHGVDLNRQEIVDDAIAMMDRLVDTVRDEGVNTVGQATAPVLSVSEVETLLASVPGVEAAIEHTADIAVEAEIRYEAEVHPEPIFEPVRVVEHIAVEETLINGVVVEESIIDEVVVEPAFTEVFPNDAPTEPNPIIASAEPESAEPASGAPAQSASLNPADDPDNHLF